jgi:hypothetical protein
MNGNKNINIDVPLTTLQKAIISQGFLETILKYQTEILSHLRQQDFETVNKEVQKHLSDTIGFITKEILDEGRNNA